MSNESDFKCPADTNGDGDCGRPACGYCHPEHQSFANLLSLMIACDGGNPDDPNRHIAVSLLRKWEAKFRDKKVQPVARKMTPDSLLAEVSCTVARAVLLIEPRFVPPAVIERAEFILESLAPSTLQEARATAQAVAQTRAVGKPPGPHTKQQAQQMYHTNPVFHHFVKEKIAQAIDEWESPTVNELKREIARLREGNFTPEEFQNLCHNHCVKEGDPNGPEVFCDGCEEYQKKLFGWSPITKLKEALAARTIYEFSEDEIPVFRPGTGQSQHENEEIVTAERCNQLVAMIDVLRVDSNELTKKLNEAKVPQEIPVGGMTFSSNFARVQWLIEQEADVQSKFECARQSSEELETFLLANGFERCSSQARWRPKVNTTMTKVRQRLIELETRFNKCWTAAEGMDWDYFKKKNLFVLPKISLSLGSTLQQWEVTDKPSKRDAALRRISLVAGNRGPSVVLSTSSVETPTDSVKCLLNKAAEFHNREIQGFLESIKFLEAPAATPVTPANYDEDAKALELARKILTPEKEFPGGSVQRLAYIQCIVLEAMRYSSAPAPESLEALPNFLAYVRTLECPDCGQDNFTHSEECSNKNEPLPPLQAYHTYMSQDVVEVLRQLLQGPVDHGQLASKTAKQLLVRFGLARDNFGKTSLVTSTKFGFEACPVEQDFRVRYHEDLGSASPSKHGATIDPAVGQNYSVRHGRIEKHRDPLSAIAAEFKQGIDCLENVRQALTPNSVRDNQLRPISAFMMKTLDKLNQFSDDTRRSVPLIPLTTAAIQCLADKVVSSLLDLPEADRSPTAMKSCVMDVLICGGSDSPTSPMRPAIAEVLRPPIITGSQDAMVIPKDHPLSKSIAEYYSQDVPQHAPISSLSNDVRPFANIISRAKFSGKWLELWFRDGKNDPKQWDFCCKQYMFDSAAENHAEYIFNHGVVGMVVTLAPDAHGNQEIRGVWPPAEEMNNISIRGLSVKKIKEEAVESYAVYLENRHLTSLVYILSEAIAHQDRIRADLPIKNFDQAPLTTSYISQLQSIRSLFQELLRRKADHVPVRTMVDWPTPGAVDEFAEITPEQWELVRQGANIQGIRKVSISTELTPPVTIPPAMQEEIVRMARILRNHELKKHSPWPSARAGGKWYVKLTRKELREVIQNALTALVKLQLSASAAVQPVAPKQ